jgi:hypothetical protein
MFTQVEKCPLWLLGLRQLSTVPMYLPPQEGRRVMLPWADLFSGRSIDTKLSITPSGSFHASASTRPAVPLQSPYSRGRTATPIAAPTTTKGFEVLTTTDLQGGGSCDDSQKKEPWTESCRKEGPNEVKL